MRTLTIKQKAALLNEVKKYFKKYGEFPRALDELDNLEDIDLLHPCEIFWQNANNYVEDLRWNPALDYMFKRW
jgi:Flp pilus assembly CpaF family ATPase